MISRLTAFAALFAVVTTASIAFAASAQQHHQHAVAGAPMQVVHLERVVITGRRLTDSN